jgi:hypothetical protein
MRSTIHTFGSELKDSVACRLEADWVNADVHC